MDSEHFEPLKLSKHFKHSNFSNMFKRVEYVDRVGLLKKLILTRWNAWGGKRIE